MRAFAPIARPLAGPMVALAALVALTSGCRSSVDLDGVVFACASDDECALPHRCIAGVCAAPSGDVSAADVEVDADAGALDATDADDAIGDTTDAVDSLDTVDAVEVTDDAGSDALDASDGDASPDVAPDADEDGEEDGEDGSDCVATGIELCNGKDDDCDGETDEGQTWLGTPLGQACDGIGFCGFGKVECGADGAATCSTNPGGSASQAKAETCNDADDDCDGQTDEDFLYEDKAIGAVCDGLGACGIGKVVCGLTGATCSTNPDGGASGAVTESCNGKDDDCDGETDEDCKDVDEDGYCAGSVVVEAGFAGCKASGDCNDGDKTVSPAAAEACDNVDNDCDGQTDNTAGSSDPLEQSCYGGAEGTAGKGLCKAGTQVCSAGGWTKTCAGEVVPTTEVCGNNQDDDCDGAKDEGCGIAFSGGHYPIGCMQPPEICPSDQMPPFPGKVTGFSLDIYEVSVSDYAACVDAGKCTAPQTGAQCNWGVSGREQHPVNCVSQTAARAYCAWAHTGGDLPTEQQWEGAAWGESCVVTGPPPNTGCGVPKVAHYPWGDDAPACGKANGLSCKGDSVPVGAFPQGTKGLFDMGGNVAEWTRSFYTTYPYEDPGPTTGSTVVVRGGAWDASKAQLEINYRQAESPSLTSPKIGFRCAW